VNASSTLPLRAGVNISANQYFNTHPAAKTITICADQRCSTVRGYQASVQAAHLDHIADVSVKIANAHGRVLLRAATRARYYQRSTGDSCGHSFKVRSVSLGIGSRGRLSVIDQAPT
jgi:hypothetical protein